MTSNIRSVIQGLDIDGVVELFELNLYPITGVATDRFLFYAGTNQNDQPVTWNGEVYSPYPFQFSGFEKRTNGTQPRPSLSASNSTGLLTALSLAYDDLVGAQVIRRSTLVRFLDRVNFPPRRNLLLDSTSMVTGWGLNNATKTTQTKNGPVNKADVIKLMEDSTSSAVHALVHGGFTADGLNPLTISMLLQNGDRRYARVMNSNSAQSVTASVIVDLQNGKVVSQAVAGGAVIQGVPTLAKHGEAGFYKLSYTTLMNTSAAMTLRVNLVNASLAVTYTGNGTSYILVSAPQVEQSSKASPFQPIAGVYDANPDADPNSKFPDEIYYIEKKVRGNKNSYEWELVTATDLEGFRLPARPITANVCPWTYKGEGCSYTGTNYFDAQDNPVFDPALDVCSKSLDGCKGRFGANQPINFGGFPGARAYKF